MLTVTGATLTTLLIKLYTTLLMSAIVLTINRLLSLIFTVCVPLYLFQSVCICMPMNGSVRIATILSILPVPSTTETNVFPPIRPSAHSSVRSSVHPLIIHLFILSSLHLSVHPSICSKSVQNWKNSSAAIHYPNSCKDRLKTSLIGVCQYLYVCKCVFVLILLFNNILLSFDISEQPVLLDDC